MHRFLKFTYFGITLYMFRTVLPSITRGSRMYILQQVYVKQILPSACHHQEFKTVHTSTGIRQTDTVVCLLAGMRWNCKTLQRQKTIKAATPYSRKHELKFLYVGKQKNWPSSVSFPLASRRQYLFDMYLLLYVQSWTPDDGRKDRRKHIECYPRNKINLRSWCILLDLPQNILRCTVLWTANVSSHDNH